MCCLFGSFIQSLPSEGRSQSLIVHLVSVTTVPTLCKLLCKQNYRDMFNLLPHWEHLIKNTCRGLHEKMYALFCCVLNLFFFPDLHFVWHMSGELKHFIVLLLCALSNTFSYCLWLLCMKTWRSAKCRMSCKVAELFQGQMAKS